MGSVSGRHASTVHAKALSVPRKHIEYLERRDDGPQGGAEEPQAVKLGMVLDNAGSGPASSPGSAARTRTHSACAGAGTVSSGSRR